MCSVSRSALVVTVALRVPTGRLLPVTDTGKIQEFGLRRLARQLVAEHPEIAGIIVINPLVESDDFPPLLETATAMLEAGTAFMPGVGNDVADPDVTELAYESMPSQSVVSLAVGLAAQKQRLSQIQVPALILRSTQDHIVPPTSVKLLTERLSGPVEVIELARSFHVATIDLDKEEINRRSLAFAAQVTRMR